MSTNHINSNDSSGNERPQNIGILAMDIYFPTRYVSQEDLEIKDNCKGKYTIGLGQLNMAFSDDREDINSAFLTVTQSLFEKYSIHPNEIGRLEIGTETLIDKSKSSKTVIMRLFGDNTDIEGVTSVNACYGGTAALFNAIAWIDSTDWDGRYALVICGDIAVYEPGPARPTGGFGTLAILLGPNAPLAFESKIRSSHNLDVYDFYKPYHSEYAAVDGKLSQWAYLSSVDKCYQRYKQKYLLKNTSKQVIHDVTSMTTTSVATTTNSTTTIINLTHFDYVAFHSPYNKLVQKGFSRLVFMDFLAHPHEPQYAALLPYMTMNIEETYENKEVDAICRQIAQNSFTEKVMPACEINQNIGNCYTGSVFSSLLSVVAEQGQALVGKRVLMFSYGSGSVASMYSFIGRNTTATTASSRFSLDRIQSVTDVLHRLNQRIKCTPEDFTTALENREKMYGKSSITPIGGLEFVTTHTYYLESINDKYHRTYTRKS